MQGIDDFVKAAAETLGEHEDSTRSATAGLLEALREQAAQEDFRKVLDTIPGAELLLHTHAAETAEKAEKGLAGAIGWVRAWMGGTNGEIGFLTAIEEAGFSSGHVGQFVAMFEDFAAGLAGQEAVRKVFSEAPDLAMLVPKYSEEAG